MTTEAGQVVVRIGSDVRGLEAGLAKGSAEVQAFGSRMNKLGKSMTKYVTLPIAAVGVGAVAMALDFEESMTDIEALVGTSAEEVEHFKKQILELAPAVGKSPKELADAFYFISSSGLEGAEAMEALRASAEASAAGLGETKVIADAVTSAMNAYGSETLSASDATDILLAAVREGKNEPEELAASIGEIIPIAQAMGVSFGEVAGMMAALSLNGTNAAEAATQITAGLAQAIKPTKEGAERLKTLGMGYDDLRRSIKERGLQQTFLDLKEAFNGNVEKVGEVFGNIRALRGEMTLTGPAAKKYAEIIDEVSNAHGDAAKAAEIALSKPGAKIQKAWAGIQASLIEIGDVLVPVVADVADAVSGLVHHFEKLSPATKEWIVKLAGAAALVGPIIMLGLKFVALAKAIKQAALMQALLNALMQGGGTGGLPIPGGKGMPKGGGKGVPLPPVYVPKSYQDKMAEAIKKAAQKGAKPVGMALGSSLGTVMVFGAMSALPLILAKLQKKVDDTMTVAEKRAVGSAGGGAFWGSSKGAFGGSGRHRGSENAAVQEAKKTQAELEKVYKPITQVLEQKWKVVGYDKAQSMLQTLRNMEELAKKGIELDFSKLGKMGPEALNKLKLDLMGALDIGPKAAQRMLNDINRAMGGAGKLKFKLPKLDAEDGRKLVDESFFAGVNQVLKENGVKGAEDYASGLAMGEGPTRKAANSLSKGAVPKVASTLPIGKLVGKQLAQGENAVKSVVEKASSGLSSAATPSVPDTYGLGLSIGQGLAAGMNASAITVEEAAAMLAQKANAALHAGVKNPPSPSRVTLALGKSLGQGLAQGMDEETATVVAAASRMASSATDAISGVRVGRAAHAVVGVVGRTAPQRDRGGRSSASEPEGGIHYHSHVTVPNGLIVDDAERFAKRLSPTQARTMELAQRRRQRGRARL